MQIRNLIEKHQVKFRHNVSYRFKHDVKSITIDDQEEACKKPWFAYDFAVLNIHGTDIIKCQEAACKELVYAFYFAKDVPGADVEYCKQVFKHNRLWLDKFDKMIAKKNANNKRNRKTPG